MPNGMTKRTLNRTTFNTKENVIYWKVFVVFILDGSYSPDSLFRVDLESSKPTQKLTFAQEALIGVSVDGVSEKRTIDSLFDQFMQPTVVRHPQMTLRCATVCQQSANNRCLLLTVLCAGERLPQARAAVAAAEQGQRALPDAPHPLAHQQPALHRGKYCVLCASFYCAVCCQAH
jgi:hypothetical protein